MMLLPLIVIAFVQDGDLTLRRGEIAPAEKIAFMSTEGVVVEDETGTRYTIGWQRVLQIEGEFADQWSTYRTIADRAWRAKVRLERGDIAAAEPLLEELAVEFAGKEGPTAEMVWTGLLRARLQRGAHLAAVEPWLELISGDGKHIASSGEIDEFIIDARSGLVPALPPIWGDWPAVQAFAAKDFGAAEVDSVSAQLAILYRAAARIEAGWDLNEVKSDLELAFGDQGTRGDAGVHLVEQVVRSRIGNAQARADARASLMLLLDSSSNAWEHAWIRCAIGRSLIHEIDEDQQRRGIVQLLYVPAALSDAHPYLAGLGLAESVLALDRLDDREGADQLYAELVEKYADHPVMDWPDIRERRPSG